MTWQIREIAVYRAKPQERRIVSFNSSRLNIITGRSRRGKSAILEIVDYCLLSKTCRIPKGIVRQALGAVGLLIERDGERVAVVRRIPKPGKLRSDEIWMDRGPASALPLTIPDANRSYDVAKDELSAFTGIEDLPLLSAPSEGDRDDRAPANLRHCVPYMFQHQDVIGNRNVVFSGADGYWQQRHLVDALAYFLKVLTIDSLAKRRRLNQLKAQLADEKRRNAESSALASGGFERGLSLWDEARALELVDGEQAPKAVHSLDASLRRATHVSSSDELSDTATQIGTLETQERDLLRQQDALRREKRAADNFLLLTSEGAAAAQGLLRRIDLRQLLPEPSDDTCPICGNQLPNKVWDQQMVFAAETIGSEATVNPRLTSGLERRTRQLEGEMTSVSERLRVVRRSLTRARETLSSHATNAERNEGRQRLSGKIDEYLRSVTSLFLQHSSTIERLELEISGLDAEVGDAAIGTALTRSQAELSRTAHELSVRLSVEFPNSAVRLRLSDLTIEVQFGSSWVHLSELGSGANWLHYHVACILALHRLFSRLSSPVPSVLLLDQPSQAWFPPDRAELGKLLEPTDDEDKLAVRTVYALLRDFCDANGFQIIVVDHARLTDDWFRSAIVEDWHGQGALVPEHWLETPEGEN